MITGISGSALSHLGQEVESGPVGKPQVEKDQVRAFLHPNVPSLRERSRGAYPVAVFFEGSGKKVPQGLLIIDDDYRRGHRSPLYRLGHGIVTVTRVPPIAGDSICMLPPCNSTTPRLT